MFEAASQGSATGSHLRVFTGADGGHGNPLWVLEGAPRTSAEEMLAITRRLGYSETVVLDEIADGEVRYRIFNPVEELPFAGHPTVGVAWLLDRAGADVSSLRCPAGVCRATVEGEITWIAGRTEWAPPWASVQFETPAEVDALTGPPDGHDFVQTWAWADEENGRVRARVFAPRVDIPEDEACGSASLLLAARLRREIEIDHGRGSVVYARSAGDRVAEVGGRVSLDSREPHVATP